MRFFGFKAFTVALALPLMLGSGVAHATLVTGNSSGSFSNISGCPAANCRVVDGNGGKGNVLEWGYAAGSLWGRDYYLPGSTLVANNRSWSVETDRNDQVLAELVWTNLATYDSITPDAFSAKYMLNIAFSKPTVSQDKEEFQFSIFNTENTSGDTLLGLTLADLANLSFSLAGVQVSDLKYQLAEGSAGVFDGKYWSNPENKTSTMYITADFKASGLQALPSNVRAVPEPASLALLGAGLLGIGAVRRKKAASRTSA